MGPAGGVEAKVELAAVKPWSRSMSLAFEKEVLGFYLSDHPLKGFENVAAIWTSGKVSDLPRLLAEHKAKASLDTNKQKYDFRNRDGNKKRVVISGIIVENRELITKKGTRMSFAKLEDLTGSLELVIFPDTFAQVEVLLKEERPLLVGGFLEGEDGAVKIIVDSVMLLEEALKRTKRMVVYLNRIEEKQYETLNSLLREYPGSTQVEMRLEIPDLNQEIVIESEGISGVTVSNEFLETLHSQIGRTDFVEMKI
jgi:DNA polymerase-3 subunit alpha